MATASHLHPTLRDQVLKSLDRLPPLSHSVGALLAKLAFRNVELHDIAAIVNKDALLAAHILRAVNSAAFAHAGTITSVQQAMVLLGLAKLRRLALGFSLTSLFSKTRMPQSWSRTRFNSHSAATAVLAELIADAVPRADRQVAFMAGLLHDIGKLLIAVTTPLQFEKVQMIASVSGEPLVECERKLLGTDHAELSGLALTRWSLPGPVYRAVFHHHATDLFERLQADPSCDYLLLSLILQRADHFINYLGLSVTEHAFRTSEVPCLEIPGHPYPADEVLERFEREWKELSPYFK